MNAIELQRKLRERSYQRSLIDNKSKRDDDDAFNSIRNRFWRTKYDTIANPFKWEE